MNLSRDRIGLFVFNLRHLLSCWGALREWLAEHRKPWRDRLRAVLHRKAHHEANA